MFENPKIFSVSLAYSILGRYDWMNREPSAWISRCQ